MKPVLQCCIPQIAAAYEVDPQDTRYQKEFILHLEKCERCGNQRAVRIGLDYNGDYREIGKIRVKRIQEEIIPGRRIHNLPSFTAPPIGKKFWLGCIVWGQYERCYSNLSGTKLGRVEFETAEDIENSIKRFSRAISAYRQNKY